MLGLYVCLADERTTRFEMNKTRVRIGASSDNDLVLSDGNVLPFHCELQLRDSTWHLACCDVGDGRPAPIRLKNRLVDATTRVADGDDIRVGDYTLVLELVPRGSDRPADPTEQSLLDAVAAQRDDESRLVYADWLEEHGDRFRAEFLRLSQRLAGIMPSDRPAWHDSERERRRLRELANHIDIAWRERVSRVPVEGCRRPTSDRCTMDWGRLADTKDPAIRHCERCGDDVHYCDTIIEARDLANRGRRVALDIRVTEPLLPAYERNDDGGDEDAETLPRP